MGSRQWLQDNPKVISYVPKHVHQQLQEFAKEQDISISKAVIFIMEEYFELKIDQSFSSNSSEQETRIRNIEQKIEELESQILNNQPTELNNQPTKDQRGETESTQKNEPSKAPKNKFVLSTSPEEPVDQTVPSNKAKEDYSQEQKTISDYFSKPSQDSFTTQEENIPISATTRMPRGSGESGENIRMNSSKNKNSSSNRNHQSKEKESSDNSSVSSSKGFLGGLFSGGKLIASNKDGSPTSRPALPPSSDP